MKAKRTALILAMFLVGPAATSGVWAGGNSGGHAGGHSGGHSGGHFGGGAQMGGFHSAPHSGTALAPRFAGGSRGNFGSGHHHFGFHHRQHFGAFIAAPLIWPWYSYAPDYYGDTAPPRYVVPEGRPLPAQPYYWYRCDDPQGYYPYVKECPGGWQEVEPENAPAS